MSTTIIRPKDREAWLQGRKQGIGSSEVGTILGLNPFETPYQLWRRKRGMDAPVEENEAMLMGHLLEDAVATRWAMATGNEIIKRSAVDWIIVNNERDYLRVSPDRTYWLQGMPKNDKNKGILECKTTMMKIDEDDIPQHWFCQLQYQLGVAELNEGALAWLVQGRQFCYKPLRFDAEFYAFIVEEVERFWRDNIIGGAEPLSINGRCVGTGCTFAPTESGCSRASERGKGTGSRTKNDYRGCRSTCYRRRQDTRNVESIKGHAQVR